MDLERFLHALKEAKSNYETVEAAQKKLEKELVKQEAPLVRAFAQRLAVFEKTINVHGEDAVLLYKFDTSGKTLISPEVYLKQNGEIVYEVYDEEGYRRYRPTAIIEDYYNIISLEEFLLHCPFYEIYTFFQNRIEFLDEEAEIYIENNRKRRIFIEKMSKALE